MPNPPTNLTRFGAATGGAPIPPAPLVQSIAALRDRAIAGDPVATAQLKALQALARDEPAPPSTPRPASAPGVPPETYAGGQPGQPPQNPRPTLSGGLNPLNHLSLDAGIENLIGPSSDRRQQEELVDDPAAVPPPVPPRKPTGVPFPPGGEFGSEPPLAQPAPAQPLPMPPQVPPRPAGMPPATPDLNAIPPALGPAGEPLLARAPGSPQGPMSPTPEQPLMPSRGGAPGPAGARNVLIASANDGTGAAAAPQPAAGTGTGDAYRGLLDFGLATLAASGRPGATALSSIGQGGLAALQGADAREFQRAAAEAAARKEGRENRELDIKEQDAVLTAQLRLKDLEQRADDKSLDREMRRDLAKDANELRKMIAEATAGNTAALRGLQEQSRQDRLDNAAANMYARFVNGARMSSSTGEIKPQEEAKFREQVAKLYPGSSFATEYGQPAGGDSPDVMAQARDAIAAGADPAAVKARLTSMGLDASGL